MRKVGIREYHGKIVKVILAEYHEIIGKDCYHGTNKDVVEKMYHEKVADRSLSW